MKAPDLSYRCGLKWDDLPGPSNTVRHCQRCGENVFNLTGMSRARARRILDMGNARPCVHFVTRGGEIVHDGDPLEQLHRQRRGAKKLLAGALMIQIVALNGTSDWVDPFAVAAQSAAEAASEAPEDPALEPVDDWMGF